MKTLMLVEHSRKTVEDMLSAAVKPKDAKSIAKSINLVKRPGH